MFLKIKYIETMYFILADDFLVSGYCRKCKKDTKWIVCFHSINFENNTISFITECCDCVEKNPKLKGFLVKIDFEDWLLLIPHSYLHDN